MPDKYHYLWISDPNQPDGEKLELFQSYKKLNIYLMKHCKIKIDEYQYGDKKIAL